MLKNPGIDFAALMSDLQAYVNKILDNTTQEKIEVLRRLLQNKETPLSDIKTFMTLGRNVSVKIGKEEDSVNFEELLRLHKTGVLRGRLYRGRSKMDTPAVWLTENGRRPGENDWAKWNGGFLIDLDLMDKKSLPDNYTEIISTLKKAIDKRLRKYYWYVWSTSSFSGTGLHIRTHSEVGLFKRLLALFFNACGAKYDASEISRIAFYLNLLHKYSICYKELLKCADVLIPFGASYDETWLCRSIDKAMFTVAQCAIVSYDPDICVNPGFKSEDLAIEVNCFNPELVREFIALPKVQKATIFKISEKKQDKCNLDHIETERQYDPLLAGIDLSRLRKDEFVKYDVLYDQDNDRHRLYWWTEVYLYQYTGHDIIIAEQICRFLFNSASKSYRKIKANLQNIATHNYWVNDEIERIMSKVIPDISSLKLDRDMRIMDINYERTYRLNKHEYVSKYIDEILNAFPLGQIGVMDAGAGTGKTDAIIALAGEIDLFRESPHPSRGTRMLIIEPYKSIVISKFDRIAHFSELLYEDKRFVGDEAVCVTLVDKFFDIDLECHHYDYIIVDESHLMATSEFRAKCGLMMDQLMTTHYSKTRILFMTGTPIFEQQFFPDAHYFRIEKEETRRRTLDIVSCGDYYDRMAKAMMGDLAAGKKIIFIVKSKNQADTIPLRLETYNTLGRPVRTDKFFSNARQTQAAKDILHKRTLGDVDVVFVTAVLSVGVDITEDKNVVLYASHKLNWVEIEQYGNRLRGCDISFKMYLYADPKDRVYREPSSFSKQDTTDRDTYVLRKLNEDTSSYDTLLNQYHISYFVQDRITGFWSINNTLRKINEQNVRWREWSCQPMVTMAYMERLGYEVSLNKKASGKADLLTRQQMNRMKKKRSQEKYHFAKQLLNEYEDVLRKAVENAGTYYDQQLKANTVIELAQLADKDTIYTNQPEIMGIIYRFLVVCNRQEISFENGVDFIRSQMSKNNQISLPQIEHLTQRLYFNRSTRPGIPEVIRRVETLQSEHGDTVASVVIQDAITSLIEIYFGHNKMNEDRKTREIFSRLLKCYYLIREKKGSQEYTFKRYDPTFEQEHAKTNRSKQWEEVEDELSGYLMWLPGDIAF